MSSGSVDLGANTGSGGGGGGGGVTTLAPVGNSPNANAGIISGSTLTLEPANATHPGVVTAGTQTFGGTKTFDTIIVTPQASEVGITINAASGQTADLLEWYDQFGARQGLINNQGALAVTADVRANNMRLNGMDFPNTIFNSGNPISIAATNGAGMIIDSANRVGIAAGTPTLSAQFLVQNQATGRITEVIQAIAAQTVDLTQWQDSSNAVLAKVTKEGIFSSSGIVQPITSKTADYTLLATDYTVIFTGSTAAQTFTLPAASGAAGQLYRIVNKSSVSLGTSAYIDLTGASATSVGVGVSITIQSDGTNWQQV